MPNTEQTQPNLCFNLTATFGIGQDTTEAVDLNGTVLMGFLTPASGLTATSFTFLASVDGTNFYPLVDMSNGNTLSAAAVTNGKYYATGPLNFSSVRFLKIVGNTNQLTAAKTLTLVTRPVA